MQNAGTVCRLVSPIACFHFCVVSGCAVLYSATSSMIILLSYWFKYGDGSFDFPFRTKGKHLSSDSGYCLCKNRINI